MKHILLSADSELSVYSVPGVVADNLEKYCEEFSGKWLWTSPYAEKHRTVMGVCFDEHDFIEYLNTWVFPHEQSLLIEKLDKVWNFAEVPAKYKNCRGFNF